MVITRQQMADYKASGSALPVSKWIEENKVMDVEVIKPKENRKDIMASLDELGIEYKKNAKTSDLAKLLED